MILNSALERHRKLFYASKKEEANQGFASVDIPKARNADDYKVKAAIKPASKPASKLASVFEGKYEDYPNIEDISYPMVKGASIKPAAPRDFVGDLRRELGLERRLFSQNMEEDYYG